MYTPSEIVERALASKENKPGYCQQWTWQIMGAHSVGDVDGDKAADAEDGWKSEPEALRHPGDRKPPKGMPVAYAGGSNDNGHRAISLGPINGVWMIRSTDADGTGRVGTVPLDWPEKKWGLTYLGWSPTISGEKIPPDAKPTPPPAKPKPPTKVDISREAMENNLTRLKAARSRAIRKGYDNRVAELTLSIRHQRKALEALPDPKN